MSTTQIILGPPGTGKTTELLKILSKYLDSGGTPDKVGFISYTKKSVNEARDRVAKTFHIDIKEFLYFRTIHSLAFLKLGMSTVEVMQTAHYREIGNAVGIEITSKKSESDYSDLKKGDQMVMLEAMSRLKGISALSAYDSCIVDFSKEEFLFYVSALSDYKKSRMLYDFTDMLVLYSDKGPFPPLDLLLVDEAQDLCWLQWQIVEKLRAVSKQTIIAGDDDQAIFSWSGADVGYFINLCKKTPGRVLHQSYRVPKKINALASHLSYGLFDRVEKYFSPTKIEGAVYSAVDIEDIDMSSGEWLILIRNSFLEESVVSSLRMCGYFYESKRSIGNIYEELYAAQIWEKLKKNSITIKEALLVLSFIKNKKEERPFKNMREKELLTRPLFEGYTGIQVKENWYDALDKISVEDREYIIASRRRGESLNKTPRIRVSTIHGAKGGEADNVVVYTDVAKKTYDAMQKNMDDELRVFYVAVTRARQNLYLIQASTRYYFPVEDYL